VIGAKAPAKINLFFEVGKKREDGYHDVLSVYQSLDLFEEVFVEPADNWTVSVTGDLPEAQLGLVPTDETNLVVKAAKALANFVGIDNPQPMHIKIHKRVPAAGGVAGGSADAAATLVALNEAWCLGLERAELSKVAAELGADVPFSLSGGAALGTGTGTELEVLPKLPMQHVLLVFSQPGLSTKQVFEVFDESFPEGDLRAKKADFAAGFDLGLAGRNSLLVPAQALRSDLAELMNLIPGEAKLSGSGPTLYLLSSDQGEISKWRQSYQALGLPTLLTSFGAEGAGLI
jgi:4-diphosphocytidyl-2C-methyl-D-erythritol kinase